MEKLRNFFKNKIVMIVEAVLIIASSAGLTFSGISADGIEQFVKIGGAIIAALDGLLTLIAGLTKKDVSETPKIDEK